MNTEAKGDVLHVSVSAASFSLLSFLYALKEEQAFTMPVLPFSPFLSGVPNGSNTLVLIPLLPDQTGKKACCYSGSIFTFCASYCLILNSIWLERKGWEEIVIFLSTISFQLLVLITPGLTSANSNLNHLKCLC